MGFDPCETGWASLQLDACVTNILIGKLTPHIGQSSKGAFLQTNKILHAIFFIRLSNKLYLTFGNLRRITFFCFCFDYCCFMLHLQFTWHIKIQILIWGTQMKIAYSFLLGFSTSKVFLVSTFCTKSPSLFTFLFFNFGNSSSSTFFKKKKK